MSESETPSLSTQETQEENGPSSGSSENDGQVDHRSNKKLKVDEGMQHGLDAIASNQNHTSRNRRGTRKHDLRTVNGQLENNPNMSLEHARLKAKREYNRKNAARARARNKEMVQDLQAKVSYLNKHTTDLERENELLSAQVQVLYAQQAKKQQRENSSSLPTQKTVPTSSDNQGVDLGRLMEMLQNQKSAQPEPPPGPSFVSNSSSPSSSQGDGQNQLASVVAQLLGSNTASASSSRRQQPEQSLSGGSQLIHILGQLFRKSSDVSSISSSATSDNNGYVPNSSSSRAVSVSDRSISSASNTGQDSLHSFLAQQRQKNNHSESKNTSPRPGQSEEDIRQRLNSLNGTRNQAPNSSTGASNSGMVSLQGFLTQAQLLQQLSSSNVLQQQRFLNNDNTAKHFGNE